MKELNSTQLRGLLVTPYLKWLPSSLHHRWASWKALLNFNMMDFAQLDQRFPTVLPTGTEIFITVRKRQTVSKGFIIFPRLLKRLKKLFLMMKDFFLCEGPLSYNCINAMQSFEFKQQTFLTLSSLYFWWELYLKIRKRFCLCLWKTDFLAQYFPPHRSLTQRPGGAAEARCLFATYDRWVNPDLAAGGPASSAWQHPVISSGVSGVLPGASLLQRQHVQRERFPPSEGRLCKGLPSLPSQVTKNSSKSLTLYSIHVDVAL